MADSRSIRTWFAPTPSSSRSQAPSTHNTLFTRTLAVELPDTMRYSPAAFTCSTPVISPDHVPSFPAGDVGQLTVNDPDSAPPIRGPSSCTAPSVVAESPGQYVTSRPRIATPSPLAVNDWS